MCEQMGECERKCVSGWVSERVADWVCACEK